MPDRKSRDNGRNVMKMVSKLRYLAAGIYGRLTQAKVCPVCGSQESCAVDRKYIYTLEKCYKCRILFRFPVDTDNTERYQEDCDESGFSWELPSDEELERLKVTAFAGTFRDIRPILPAIECLVKQNARILDFGASWGYQTFQFNYYGYEAVGYEIGRSRAQAGSRLGVKLYSDFALLDDSFDLVYSSHVVEHVKNPKEILELQLSKVRPNGFVFGLVPNGSEAYRKANPGNFHLAWGKVHPVFLNDEFLQVNFGTSMPIWVGGRKDIVRVSSWDQRASVVHETNDCELMFIIKKMA